MPYDPPPELHENRDADELVQTARPAPKFCRRCGAPWQADRSDCSECDRPSIASIPRERSTLTSALTLYFILLATLLLVIVGDGSAMSMIALAIIDSAIVLIWCAVRFREIGPSLTHSPALKWYALAFGAAFATFIVASLSVLAMQWLFDVPEIRYSEEFLAANFGWGMVVLIVCIQPAIIEELAFRGIILSALQPMLCPREAVIVSSLMFMVIHLSLPSFPHLFAIGLVLGYLRVVTGSLWPCMLMHFVHNGLVVLLEYTQG